MSVKIAAWVCLMALGSALTVSGQLTVSATGLLLTLPADLAGAGCSVYDAGGKNIKFKFSGFEPILNAPPDFVVVVPSSSTTPAFVRVGLNPGVVPYLNPRLLYEASLKFSTVDQTPAQSGSCIVRYFGTTQPLPVIQSIVSGASFQSPLSPGALFTIFGTGLAAPTLTAGYDDTGSYPTSLGNSTVTMNGTPAHLLFVSPNQINALVPSSLAGQKSVDVVVRHFNSASATFTVNLNDTAPALFTSTQTGTGQAVVLQQGPDLNFTANGSSNPAPAGTAFEMFGSGSGLYNPPFPSDIHLDFTTFTAQPVSVLIGGKPARVLYAGPVGYQEIWSLLQVNAVVPDGLAPGPQPLILKIGQNDNAAQKAVIFVQ